MNKLLARQSYFYFLKHSFSAALSRPIHTIMSQTELNSQEYFLLNDKCVIVDNNDIETGHTWSNIQSGHMLHRAFSVICKNKSGKIVLQRRSDSKPTFAGYLTNFCCSHQKQGESDKDAAIRRIKYEINLDCKNVDFITVRKFLYKAQCDNQEYGEHECDHIIFSIIDVEEDYTGFNKDEISELKFYTEDELNKVMEDSKEKVSPWFKIIHKTILKEFWNGNWDKIIDLEVKNCE